MHKILFATTLLISLSTSIADNNRVPIMVGRQPDLDACTSTGAVFGLDPKGDAFLAVRAGPGVNYKQIDKLLEHQQVFICDASANNKWLGIVYTKKGRNCGVSSPITPVQPYKGKCLSGWVSSHWIRVIAG